MAIRLDPVQADAQGLPVVTWEEDRNLFAPEGPGPARVACFIRPDQETGVLQFVASGSVRHGSFEEARPWETLKSFEKASADQLYYGASDRAALDLLAGKSKSGAGRILAADGAFVMLANFADERASVATHLNCADATFTDMALLHDRLQREFIGKRLHLINELSPVSAYPLDRRVYEIGRKHCGMQQEKWRISMDKLQKRTGSKQERKHFAAHMRSLVQSNHLPDYALTLEEDQVVFWRRAGEGAGSSYRPSVPVPAPLVPRPPEAPKERRIAVSSAAIERLYDMAPDWDKYMLEHAYIDWAKDKEPAYNEDARFLSWVGSYTKGKASP
jgi:hypothetical protein